MWANLVPRSIEIVHLQVYYKYTDICILTTLSILKNILVLRPNVPTHTTPLKYVLFWWSKSTHFWACSRRVGKLWDILSHNCIFNRGLCRICYTQPITVNWPVNHLVTVNILHISFHLTSYHIIVARWSVSRGPFMWRTLLIFSA